MRIRTAWIALSFAIAYLSSFGQTPDVYPKSKTLVSPKAGDIRGTGYEDTYEDELRTLSIHRQSVDKDDNVNHLMDESDYKELGTSLSKKADAPNVLYSSEVRFSNGFTPPDNAMAISNGNWVVCAINSRIYYFDPSGEMIGNPVFKVFVRDIPETLNGSLYDPRVIYDHENDRFIVVILHGSTPTTSRVLVFFSKTNNPTDGWHAYSLEGDAAEQDHWFDYPSIAVNKNSLFVSGNMFDIGNVFTETLVFDIDKANGFQGKDLEYGFWNALEGNNELAFTVVPVEHGTWTPYLENAYFVSNDGSFGRDVVFYELDILKDELIRTVLSTTTYGAPPDSDQQGSDDLLDGGDARIKKAIWIDKRIHYVHSTITSNNFGAVGYHVLTLDDMDVKSAVFHKAGQRRNICYPSVAAATTDPLDHTVFISYAESGTDIFARLNAITVDENMTSSTEVLLVEGNGFVNILQNDIERWGDYITLCNNFNSNTCWVFGCVGGRDEDFENFLIELSLDETSSIKERPVTTTLHPDVAVYPNPIGEKVSVRFDLDQRQVITIKLFDQQGRLVETFLEDAKKAGLHEFSFNTFSLAPGNYVISITGQKGLLASKAVVR